MHEIQVNTWSDYKTLISSKKLLIQYAEFADRYDLYAVEASAFMWVCSIAKGGGSDATDFENNYKSDANAPLEVKDDDGKPYTRAESRPIYTATWFTGSGDKTDSPEEIGRGKEFRWDMSDTTNDVHPSPPSGMKGKRLEFSFIDTVWVKEGCVYYKDKQKGSYIEFMIVCPSGQYYYKNDGTPALAASDTVISRFVNKLFMFGDTRDGDELNTEAASNPIPTNYKFWIDVLVPSGDTTSHGHVELEFYRERSVILE